MKRYEDLVHLRVSSSAIEKGRSFSVVPELLPSKNYRYLGLASVVLPAPIGDGAFNCDAY